MSARASLFVLIFSFLLSRDSAAVACSVCGDPRDPSQGAFLIGTMMLSSLPLLMLFGFFLFLRHRSCCITAKSTAPKTKVAESP